MADPSLRTKTKTSYCPFCYSVLLAILFSISDKSKSLINYCLMDAPESSHKNVFSNVKTDFKCLIIKEIFKTQYANPKTRISDDTVDLMSKIAKVLVVETAIRAAKQATAENKTTINLSHVESVLPQIMLDFP